MQSLSASVETLIGLVNKLLANGRVKKRAAADLTSTSVAAMSLLEQQVVTVMTEAVSAISACLAGRCNTTQIGQLTSQIGGLAGQFEMLTTITPAFQVAFQAASGNMQAIEATAAAGTAAITTTAAPASLTLAAAATTTSAVNTAAAASASAGACCWQFQYLPRAECIIQCQALGIQG